LFRFHKYLLATLAMAILTVLGITATVLVKFGSVGITQPIATLIGVILVPSIALLGFLAQKRVERSYDVSKEARNAAREFIDSSTAYQTALMRSDFDWQVDKFQKYQSKWFQLHTVLPEVFSGSAKAVLQDHFDALTDFQIVRNSERKGVILDDPEIRKLIIRIKNTEMQMVSALTFACTGIDLRATVTPKEPAQKDVVPRLSRGSILLQMGMLVTDRDLKSDSLTLLGSGQSDEAKGTSKKKNSSE